MPERVRMRALLQALLRYVEAEVSSAGEGEPVLAPEQLPITSPAIDLPPAPEQDPDTVSGMLSPGMSRVEFRMLRKAAGVTMAEAARLLAVTERTILRWEHGTSRIDCFKAARIREELVPGRWAKIREQDTLSGDTETDRSSDV